MFQVKDFMTPLPASIDAKTNLYIALSTMRRHRVQHLCVVESTRLVAIVSEHDILAAAPSIRVGETNFIAALIELRVGDCMSRNPRVAHPDMNITEAAEHMSDIHAHSLPVVDKGRLLGIVTTGDCIRAFCVYVRQIDGPETVPMERCPRLLDSRRGKKPDTAMPSFLGHR